MLDKSQTILKVNKSSQPILPNRLGYLSGAPRVSTLPDVEEVGPRSHVLGVINAFETLEWKVTPFIVGDRLPKRWRSHGSAHLVSGSIVRTVAADLMRISMGIRNSRKAWSELQGRVEWVYERFASFQALGTVFKQQGIPWILETNAPLFYESKADRQTIFLHQLAKFLEVKAYRECDILVCVSEALRDLIVESTHICKEKTVVIPNGVDTTLFDPAAHKPKRLYEGFTIGFIGNIIHWQALDLLLEVVSELIAIEKKIHVVIVGDGPNKAELETLAATRQIADKVTFTGRVTRDLIPQYIAGFDLGFSGQLAPKVGVMYLSPLKLYEYMAMAKPVIASQFEDAQRIITHQENGFLFNPGSKEMLKQTLMQAYEQRAMLPGMGQKARSEILAKHSWTARVSGLISHAESILNTTCKSK